MTAAAQLRRGRAVFVSSGAASKARAYIGPTRPPRPAGNPGAAWAAEIGTTNIRRQLFTPARSGTRMRASLMPAKTR